MIGRSYRSQRRIFPWISRQEFHSIYHELFSDNPELQQHALDRICVWQSRALHKLSVAIESTYTIISANLAFHRSLGHKDDIDVNLRLRKDYSLALIRFVNHLTEKSQTKQYAQPVHILAAKLGVPEWIVDLRHDATHGALPSLPVLRAGARWAMNWLKTEYWEKQVDSMEPAEIEPAYSSRSVNSADNPTQIVEDVLVSYMQHQFHELSKSALGNREAKIRVMEDLDKALMEHRVEIKRRNDPNKMISAETPAGEFVPILLKEGYLVSTHEQLQPLGINLVDLLDSSDLLLPAILVKFWRPLLRRLHDKKVIPLLLHSALSSLPTSLGTYNNTLHTTQLLRWVYTILYQIQVTEAEKDIPGFLKIFKSSCSLPYRSLLQMALRNPISLGCAALIDLLMNKQTTQALSEENRRKYQNLAAIYFNNEMETEKIEGENCAEHVDIHTIEDLTKGLDSGGGLNTPAICIQPCRDLTKGLDSGGGLNTPASCIQPCGDAVDWSKVPIGFLPNFSSLYPRLDLGDIHMEELEWEVSGTEDSMCSDEDVLTPPSISSEPCEWNLNVVLKNVKIL